MDRESDGGGMWMRGETIGRGSFGTVSLAKAKKKSNKRHRNHLPKLMAVKWAEVSRSGTLQKEREILTRLEGCPHILRCYGDEITTTENGDLTYNVLLEYASGGTLASLIKNSGGGGGGLPEADVRRYTRSILQGLNHIHNHGYVHCDIKPQNIVLVRCTSSLVTSSLATSHSGDYVAKIANFGSAKNTVREQRKRKRCFVRRGTPLYMSPESVARKEQEAPSDIWALGCVVAEMFTGKPAWNCDSDMDVDQFLSLIGSSRELPKTPTEMSKEGKDFLKRCFVRTSMFRWTADMLLHHPFVSEDTTKEAESRVQVQTAPELPNDTKVQLTGGCSIQESGRKINVSDESSIGDDRLKPVSKASITTRQQDRRSVRRFSAASFR